MTAKKFVNITVDSELASYVEDYNAHHNTNIKQTNFLDVIPNFGKYIWVWGEFITETSAFYGMPFEVIDDTVIYALYVDSIPKDEIEPIMEKFKNTMSEISYDTSNLREIKPHEMYDDTLENPYVIINGHIHVPSNL